MDIERPTRDISEIRRSIAQGKIESHAISSESFTWYKEGKAYRCEAPIISKDDRNYTRSISSPKKIHQPIDESSMTHAETTGALVTRFKVTMRHIPIARNL